MALPWNIIDNNVVNVSKVLNDLVDTTEEKDVSWEYKEVDGTIDTVNVSNVVKQLSTMDTALREYIDQNVSIGDGDSGDTSEGGFSSTTARPTLSHIANVNNDAFIGSGWVTHDDKILTIGSDDDDTLTYSTVDSDVADTFIAGKSVGANIIQLHSDQALAARPSPHIVNVHGAIHILQDIDIKVSPVNMTSTDSRSYQDFIFLESWAEDVSTKDIVYPYGNVQYTGNGAIGLGDLVEGTFTGADTYSLHGNWQAAGDLVGKGYVWSELTDEEKLTFTSNSNHNMYMDDDKWMQLRYRIRVVKGISNKWGYLEYKNVDLAGSYSVYNTDMSHQLRLQGQNTTVVDLGSDNGQLAYITNDKGNDLGSYGSSAVQAIPMALIQRRNGGIYHEVFNPYGCALIYESGVAKLVTEVTDGYITSIEDCFNPTKIAVYNPTSDSVGTLEDLNNNVLADDYKLTGTLTSDRTGRITDKLYSDVVDVKDVQDLRMSANKKSLKEISTYMQSKLANNELNITEIGAKLVVCAKKGTITLDSDEAITYFAIIKDGDTYRLWGMPTDADKNKTTDMLYFTSEDGTNWVNQPMSLTALDTTEYEVVPRTVINNNGTYTMWYSCFGTDGGSNYRINYATSTDGSTWEDHGAIIHSSGSSYPITSPSVILDGSTYKMWYSGDNSNDDGEIYYVTSTDGTAWTEPVVVLTQGSYATEDIDSGYIGDPWVMKDGTIYKMWYTGRKIFTEVKMIHHATSTDGVNWVKQSTSIPNGLGDKYDSALASYVTVIPNDGKYSAWYVGKSLISQDMSICYAEMPDHVTYLNQEAYSESMIAATTTTSDIGYIATGKYLTTGLITNSFINKFHKHGDGYRMIPVKSNGTTLYMDVNIVRIVYVLATKKDGTLYNSTYTQDTTKNSVTMNTDYATLGYDDQTDMEDNVFIRVIAEIYTKPNNLYKIADTLYSNDKVIVTSGTAYNKLMSPIINKPIADVPVNKYKELVVTSNNIEDASTSIYDGSYPGYVEYDTIEDFTDIVNTEGDVVLKLFPYITQLYGAVSFNLLYEQILHILNPYDNIPGFAVTGPLYGHDDLGEPVGPTLYKYGVAIPLGADGSTEDMSVYNPMVMLDDGVYKMWYTGKKYLDYTRRTHYATSDDAITWTKHGVVLDLGATDDTDDKYIGPFSIIKDGDTYKMWYSGGDGSNYRIHYATSTDGITWNKQGVLTTLEAGEDYDDRYDTPMAVLKDDDTYKMWYSGKADYHYNIYYATSTDGITWSKQGIVVPRGASGDTDAYDVYAPNVIKDDTVYKMWYAGSNGTYRTHYATSTDGITWVTHGVVIDVGADGETDDSLIYTPNVLLDGDVCRVWYIGFDGSKYRIHYADTELYYGNIIETKYEDNGSINADGTAYTYYDIDIDDTVVGNTGILTPYLIEQ